MSISLDKKLDPANHRTTVRWNKQEVFRQLHQYFADDADMENLLIDSTIVHAQPSTACAGKKAADKLVSRILSCSPGSEHLSLTGHYNDSPSQK